MRRTSVPHALQQGYLVANGDRELIAELIEWILAIVASRVPLIIVI